jgi:multidrug resistance efflux pump
MELRITSPFTILPAHNADVRAEIEGIIEEIYATEGDAIREGQLLARLSDREHRSELQKTKAQIQQVRARLRMQEAGPTREEIEVARAAVERAQDRLTFARARLDRDRNQVKIGLISKKEFENTQELAAVAENDLAEAENKLKVLLRGTRSEEIDATRAEMASLEAQQRYLEGQLSRVEVRSPADGIVATPARQLKEMVRQVVQKGALIARVYDLKKLTVEIPVPEKEIADVRVGQAVAFKVQAYPDKTFSGKVTSIATTALGGSPSSSGSQASLPAIPSGGSSPRTILITTEIDNRSLLLKPGMTGQAKVFCGERRIVDLMTRRLARTVKVEFWSWW